MRHIRLTLPIFLLLLGACDATTSSAVDTDAPALTFIHLNDTYRVDAVEEGRSGGFARVATVVRGLKADGRDVRMTHGGDFLFPSLESQLWNGEQMVEAMNFLDGLAPMYVVPGNHEFDRRTPQAVIDAVRGSAFTWIGDNIRLATGAADVDSALENAFLFESGTYRIGVFGLALLPRDGGNERDYAPVDGEYLRTAEESIKSLEARGADLIFGLTHLHLADDRIVAGLKERHPAFMFIVGGHEHEPEFVQGDRHNAAIMKGASNARVVWRIDVRFDGGQAQIETSEIAIDESIEEDADYLSIADKWRQRLLEKFPFLTSEVGRATVPLDGREVTIRNEESNWGNFIVDRMPGAFGEPLADLAFVNSGTLRIDDFVAEDITFEDIARTLVFSSFLRYMTITGAEFRKLLETGYRGEGPSKGYFPQISGFRVCVDRTRPEGQRIVQLQLPGAAGWHDIDGSADYSLVAPDFLYRGGDGYDFSAARNVSRPGSELKYLVLDAIVAAQAQGETVGAALDPASPRIAFLAAGRTACFDPPL